MARWKLNVPHYLHTDPAVEWEHRETDASTGRQGRKVYKVPRYINPNDPSDCNREGECVVTDGKNARPGDIYFSGPPTNEMDPLDDEARAITEEMSKTWVHPIESLPINFTQSPIPMDVPPPPKPSDRRV